MRLLAGNVAGGRERFRPAAPRLAGTLRGGVATARLQRRYRGGTGAVHTGNGNAGEAARGAAARIFGQLPGKRRQTPEKGANRRNFQYIGSSRDRKDHPPLKNRGADVFNFRLWCPMGGAPVFNRGGGTAQQAATRAIGAVRFIAQREISRRFATGIATTLLQSLFAKRKQVTRFRL